MVLPFLVFPRITEKETDTIQKPISKIQNKRNSLLTHYNIINDREAYNDSYDVYLPAYDNGCGLRFETHKLPYVERYYVCFEDYIRDVNGYSEAEEKKIVMNFGDVLLSVDKMDTEGKTMQEIRCMILYKSNQMVQLSFLNKIWFNSYDRDSVRVTSDTWKKVSIIWYC
jgi:hypothetical protein